MKPAPIGVTTATGAGQRATGVGTSQRDPSLHDPDQFAGQTASAPAPVRGAKATAATDAPPSPLMAQAQQVATQALAQFNQLAGGNRPIGETEAQEILSVLDAASAQLQGISDQASKQGAADVVTFVASTEKDLASARQVYVGMAGDIAKDDQTAQQTEQADDAAANQTLTQAEQDAAGALGPAVNDITVGNDEGDPSMFGDEDPPTAPPTPDPPMPTFAAPPGPDTPPAMSAQVAKK